MCQACCRCWEYSSGQIPNGGKRERWHLEGSECDLEPGTKSCDGAGQGLWWRNPERSRDQKGTSKAVSSGLLGTNVKEEGQLDPSGEGGFERAESR